MESYDGPASAAQCGHLVCNNYNSQYNYDYCAWDGHVVSTATGGFDSSTIITSDPDAVRVPTPWTILQQDGRNHLGLRYNFLPEHQIALITSGCVPCSSAIPVRSGRPAATTPSTATCGCGRTCACTPTALGSWRRAMGEAGNKSTPQGAPTHATRSCVHVPLSPLSLKFCALNAAAVRADDGIRRARIRLHS